MVTCCPGQAGQVGRPAPGCRSRSPLRPGSPAPGHSPGWRSCSWDASESCLGSGWRQRGHDSRQGRGQKSRSQVKVQRSMSQVKGHSSKFRGQGHRSKATRIKISNLLQVTTNMLVFVKMECTLFLYICYLCKDEKLSSQLAINIKC